MENQSNTEKNKREVKFSIILPTFNRAKFIPRAIESVLGQTYSNWELIIVDDGSTDNTKEIVERYSDPRIIYIYQSNQERGAARNTGIKNASGDFICFMDSDEYIDNNRLELLENSIGFHSYQKALYYTDIRFEFDDPKKNYVRKGREFGFPVNKDDLIRIIIGNPQLCGSRDVFEKHRYNPILTVGEDMELIFRAAEEFPLIYLPDNSSITEIEHQERSVSDKSEASLKQLNTLKIMFTKGHPAYLISCKYKKWIISEVLFNASYTYLLSGNLKGILFIIKSIFYYPFSDRTIYKLNLIFTGLFKGKKKLSRLINPTNEK